MATHVVGPFKVPALQKASLPIYAGADSLGTSGWTIKRGTADDAEGSASWATADVDTEVIKEYGDGAYRVFVSENDLSAYPSGAVFKFEKSGNICLLMVDIVDPIVEESVPNAPKSPPLD